MAMTFIETELHTIKCALEAAAEIYEKHAATAENNSLNNLARQFDRQTRDCRKLIADIEAHEPA
ncbi:hypothetical protein [Novosphingobium sp.]|uniref:hypothetical protein n=1 Tax=Novosphingobium sp. TaxID=1874826 RepID=UPI00286E4297|nr:hypothetical protein [Novosphingobium sp.]